MLILGNFVYIAASVDGYIARADGSLDWLHNIENPDGEDYGYAGFTDTIDAIVMGKNTFESVRSFEEWPYKKPVFVLSTTLNKQSHHQEYQIVSGKPEIVVKELNKRGYKNLYIDGGKTIQSFLASDLIDEMIITRIPILLGAGIPLFGIMKHEINLQHINTKEYKNGLIQNHYRIIK